MKQTMANYRNALPQNWRFNRHLLDTLAESPTLRTSEGEETRGIDGTGVGKNPMRTYAGEFFGTALLVMALVGSGILGERLSGGNKALALMAHVFAIGAALVALISLFAPLSGAHFNPLVSLAEMLEGRLPRSRLVGYLLAQFAGAMLGVLATHAMFEIPVYQLSSHIRTGMAQWFSEAVATFVLLLLVLRRFTLPKGQVPWLIGAYVMAAIWFTASFSFVNPTVTFVRAFTDTFTGIRLRDVPGFAIAETVGALAALVFHRWVGMPEKIHAG